MRVNGNSGDGVNDVTPRATSGGTRLVAGAELVAALEQATMARLGQAHDIVAMVRILATEREEASSRIASLTERLSELAPRAAEQQRRWDEAAGALAAAEAERATLREALASVRGEIGGVREAYSNAITAIDTLAQTRRDLQQQLELTQQALRESERDRTYLQQDVAVKDAYAENLLAAMRAFELHFQQTLALGRYRLADQLNARLKSFALIHRWLKHWFVRRPANTAAQ